MSVRRPFVPLIAGILVGVAITGTPAAGHVGGTIAHLWKHLQPRTDARYLESAAKPGQTFSGQISVRYVANAGHVLAQGTYPAPIPTSAPIPNLEYRPLSLPTSATCPGIGRATRGRLCVYVLNQENILGAALGNTMSGQSRRYGFGLTVHPTTPGAAGSLNANWAYTVP